jgi:molybdopterin biosynthesis enzyme
LTVRQVPWSGSSDLKATVNANGMALLLPEHGLYSPGETVEIWLWGDQRLL